MTINELLQALLDSEPDELSLREISLKIIHKLDQWEDDELIDNVLIEKCAILRSKKCYEHGYKSALFDVIFYFYLWKINK